MGRITRAKAAEVAEKLHMDEDAVLDLSSTEVRDAAGGAGMQTPEPRLNRMALAEIAPNSGGSSEDVGEDFSLFVNPIPGGIKHRGGRGVRKGVVGATVEALEERAMSLSEHRDSMPSAEMASDTISAEDLMMKEASPEHKLQTGDSSFELQDANAAPASSVEMSRAVHEDIKTTSPSDPAGSRLSGLEETSETSVSADTMPTTIQRSDYPIAAIPSTPQQNATSFIDMTGSKYDALEAAAIQAATPPRSTANSASPPHDAISALDDLEDAVEMINGQVPEVQPSPMKSSIKREKAAPLVRATKASQARISIAHGPKDAARAPALGRPRQSMAALDGKRVTSTCSVKSNGVLEDTEPPTRKEVVIPHSKPRPVSMSFPAPKLPLKSTKPPTQANFTLPGEAMSAKFKAAREAKALKEAEEAKRRVFKARPAPSMVRKDPPVVRQTSTSKARESMIGGAKPFAPSTTHNRANSVASSRPATSTFRPKPAAASNTATKRSTAPSKAVTVPKRASTAMGMLDKSSNGTKAVSRPSTAIGGNPSASGTSKGKEVFGRVAQAKGEAEREKKAKEEAAKAARVAASERSRALSREWAEKQKGKKVVTAA